MKNFLTSLAFCLFTFGISTAQITFERHYGSPSKLDMLTCVVHANDDGFLLAGTTANFGSEGLDIFLVRTNADGDTLWTKTWGGPGDDGAATLVNAGSSDGYLLAGYTTGANGSRDFLALHIDNNGEEIWSVVRGGANDDVATHALLASNGDFLVSGNTIVSPSAGQDVLALRIQPDGDVVWENEYGGPEPNTSKGVASTTDGGFILAINSNNIVKINAQGSLLWQKELDSAGFFPQIEFLQSDLGEIFVGGGNLVSPTTPFLIILNDDGDIQSNFPIQFPNASFSVHLIDARRLVSGDIAMTFRSASALTATSFQPGLALFNTNIDMVSWYHTYEDLNLADIWRPSKLLRSIGGEDIFLTGSTSSDEEGVNGVFCKYSDAGLPIWRKNFGMPALADNENARKVLQTTDGGYLVLANKAVTGNSLDFWLIKTDENGSIQWDATYGFSDADRLANLDAMPDGGYIAAGYNGTTIRVLKVNSNGQLQWLKQFDPGLADGTFGIRATPDNGCLLVFPAFPAFVFGSTLLKLNAQGDSVWSKHFTNLGTGFDDTYLYGLSFASSDRYALCGMIDVTNQTLQPAILLTDTIGNIIWAKTYDSNDQLAVLIDIHTTIGSEFVTHGIRIDNSTSGIRPYVIHTDADGNLLWTAKPDNVDARYLFPWASAITSDDYTFLFEEKRYTSVNLPSAPERDNVGSVQKLDATGQLVCEQDFGLGKSAYFLGGAATADGGAIAVGTATFDNSTDAWLVKMNANCTIGFQTPLTPPFGLSIMPNPSSGQLILEIESGLVGKISLEVVNASGQKMLQWDGEKNAEMWRQQFDLSHIANGIYFVWVQIGGKARALAWIKQTQKKPE